ncbi:MAG: membrane protein insertion efficiency factor YidD [candidate division WOR-3 bacterium]
MKAVIVGLIRFYQIGISPLLPRVCRFYPTCSEYAAQSIERYGLLKGILRSTVRVMRCNPWCAGGYDPVD